MKKHAITIVVATATCFVGCGKQNTSSGPTPATATLGAKPIAEPAMTAWEQGDKAAAITAFVAADWSSRPLFAPSSVMSLSELQFNLSSEAQNTAKSKELLAQLDALKQLARAVVQTGVDAAAKGDTAQARKCFTSVERCGAALDSSRLRMVKLVGQAFQKLAKSELAKIGH